MPTDVMIDDKGSVVLCDLAALDERPKRGDDLIDRIGYEHLARSGRLFYFEPQDALAGSIRIFVDESPPEDLVARAVQSVRGRLLRVPSGEIVVCRMTALAADAPPDELANAMRVAVEAPGDYRVDAHVLPPSDAEIEGVEPKGRAGCFQGMMILSIVWFLFCSLCYFVLVTDGLARDALPIYGVVGVAPMLLAIVLFYVTGSRRRVAEATKAYDAIPETPSLVVSLMRNQPGDEAATEGGGIADD